MKTELLISGLFLLTIFMPAVARADNSTEAAVIFQSGTEAQVMARHNKTPINTTTQAAIRKTYLDPLVKNLQDITESQKQAISNFITYGTLGTQNLNRSARYRMVLAYRVEYKKFPTSEANWLALLNQPPGMNVLICGIRVGDKHEENVKKSFILGFNSYKKDLTPDLITISTSTMPSNCFREAEENNYPMAIMSLKEASYYNEVAKNYQKVVMFMPAGSNNFKKVFQSSVASSPMVITGAGDKHNKTGYNVEFFSINPLNQKSFISSYSNGYVAGQIAYIAKKLGISVSQARTIARETASFTKSFTAENGFG